MFCCRCSCTGNLDNLEDADLKELAGRLPQTILHSSAINTVRKYLGAFRKWKTWVIEHNLSLIPAKPHEFALYLQFIGETKYQNQQLKRHVMLYLGYIQLQGCPRCLQIALSGLLWMACGVSWQTSGEEGASNCLKCWKPSWTMQRSQDHC